MHEAQHFMDWLTGTETVKHLQGQHDQRSHGHRMGVRAMANHLYDLIFEKGGYTYRPRKGSRTKGVSVSIPGHELAVPAKKVHKSTVLKYVREVMGTIKSDRRNHLGAWYDKDHNLVVFDVSRVINDRERAKRLGDRWKQNSIFDLGSGELIVLNADEGRIAAAAEKAARPSKENLICTLFPNELSEEELVAAILAFLQEVGVEVLEDEEEGGETGD